MTEQGRKIDLSKMVRGPYQPCPQCGDNTFGILSVQDKHYKRRCRRMECWHTSGALSLPAVQKRIIYLDQFAISEMAKTQDATLLRSPKRSVDPCWREISLKIQLLVGAQMIVCPASTCHFDESLVHSSYDELKATYEGVAAGVTFLASEEILIRQIRRGLQGWLSNRPLVPFAMKDVTTGKINVGQIVSASRSILIGHP